MYNLRPMIWLLIGLRVLANPFSNVFQKVLALRSADPLFIICATHGLLSLVCLPFCLHYLGSLSGEFWLAIAACAVLAVAGNAMIVQAVKLSDLSLLGPINAYKPIVSLIPGMILLQEMPGVRGLGGIGLILAGSYFLVDQRAAGPEASRGMLLTRLLSDRGVQFRVGGLVLSAIEAVFLKRAVLAASPMATFLFWAVMDFAISLVAVIVIGSTQVNRELNVLRASLREYLLLFITTGTMQLCTLLTFEVLHVGYALALFQTSAILSVLLGHRFFQERHLLQRLTGSAIMVAGAVLIITAG